MPGVRRRNTFAEDVILHVSRNTDKTGLDDCMRIGLTWTRSNLHIFEAIFCSTQLRSSGSRSETYRPRLAKPIFAASATGSTF